MHLFATFPNVGLKRVGGRDIDDNYPYYIKLLYLIHKKNVITLWLPRRLQTDSITGYVKLHAIIYKGIDNVQRCLTSHYHAAIQRSDKRKIK